MLKRYLPKLEDLWFRQTMLADPETMSYNHAWGGTIPFPEDAWRSWYEHWLVRHENKRFYRYLMDEHGRFVGEIAYHWDKERCMYFADIIIHAPQRGKGYGRQGLALLCQSAKENGVELLYDDLAIDNPALPLFLKQDFTEEYRTDQIIMLKKEL
ncbi:MAG: GNAT family N-acetyltransferase [Oscillospiraceae bacterium]|nr:GNAT family N-acetyltransferase [Oscillospiraceae bacterium]